MDERATWADVFAAIGTLIKELVRLPVTIVGVLALPLPVPNQSRSRDGGASAGGSREAAPPAAVGRAGDAILGAWVHLWETRRALAWGVAIIVGAVAGILSVLVVQFGR